MTLEQLNALPQPAFVEALAGIFEHSSWVGERACSQAPFASIDALHAVMCAVVADASADEQMALIRAHPPLAGKAALRGELTAASASEQGSAGLDLCSPEQFARITALNEAYQDTFGFPFILAVRGHSRDSIIANMDTRLVHPREAEIVEALHQIERIARCRLTDMMAAPVPKPDP